MNNHLTNLLVKFGATFAILYLVLGFAYRLTIMEILILSAVLAISTYFIGDLFILPRSNNAIATIADFGFSWAIIYVYLIAFTALPANQFIASFLAALCFSLFEIIFHPFTMGVTMKEARKIGKASERPSYQYQTEFSEEFPIDERRMEQLKEAEAEMEKNKNRE